MRAYGRPVDPEHPGCAVILIDRSYSMLEPIVGQPDVSKARAVAAAINAWILQLTGAGGGRLAPCHVGVIGYGQDVGPCMTGALSGRELVESGELLRHFRRTPSRRSPNGDDPAAPAHQWVEPGASGPTPMKAALEQCRRILEPWTRAHPRSFPPVVVNVSDGGSSDGDPLEAVARIRNLETDDGATLLLNVKVSAHADDPIAFVSDETALPGADARTLFHMSSPLPTVMRTWAEGAGLEIADEARGVVVNADERWVSTVLRVGSAHLFASYERSAPWTARRAGGGA